MNLGHPEEVLFLAKIYVGWVAAAAPAHRNTDLSVGSWDGKVFWWDLHLLESPLWLSGCDTALFHEMVERSDQVLAKVEIVVVHLQRQDYTAWTWAIVVKVLGVLERD